MTSLMRFNFLSKVLMVFGFVLFNFVYFAGNAQATNGPSHPCVETYCQNYFYLPSPTASTTPLYYSVILTNGTLPAGHDIASYSISIDYDERSGSGWKIRDRDWLTYTIDFPNRTSLTPGSGNQYMLYATGVPGPSTGNYKAVVSFQALDEDGSIATTPAGTTLTTMEVIYGYGVASPSNTCAIGSFSASPATVATNSASTLNWATSNCTSATLSGGTFTNYNALTSTTANTGNLATPTTYTISANDGTNFVTRSVTVAVTASGGTCVINSFYANPAAVQPNTSSALYWDVTDCSSLTLNGGGFNNQSFPATAPGNTVSSTSTAPISSSTTYTLTASDGTNSPTSTATVSIGGTCTVRITATGDANNFSYRLVGPGTNYTVVGFAGTQPFPNMPNGAWTTQYIGPDGTTPHGGTFVDITPNGSQSCSANSTITFTYQFTAVGAPPPVSPPPTVNNTTTDATVACERIKVSWTAATGATYYNVYRGLSSLVPGALVQGNVTSLEYTDSGVPPVYTYYYWVESANTNGTSAAVRSNPVSSVSCGPGDPGGPPTAENTAINPAVACGQIRLTWTAGAGATSYNMHRSTTNVYPGGLPWQTTAGLTYTDTTPVTGTTYYYWITSVNGSGTSAPVGTGGVSSTSCQVDLSTSGKYVARVNGQPYPYTSSCSSAPVGGPRIIKKGDKIQFLIEVCNGGTVAANNVSVSDDLSAANSNLVVSTPDNVTFVGGTSPTYSRAGNVLTFNLGTIPAGGRAAITFDADVTVPYTTTQNLLRFKNIGNVTYTSTAPASTTGCVGSSATVPSPCSLDTGYIVFYNGLKAPTIKEINP